MFNPLMKTLRVSVCFGSLLFAGYSLAEETPEALGEKVYNQYGCQACHNPSPANIAPSLVGIYGHEVKLKDGQSVVVDDAYLVESILKPQAKIVDGYATPMTPFENILSEQQVQQLVAYIKSLKN